MLNLGAAVDGGEDFGKVRLKLEQPGCRALRAGLRPDAGEFIIDYAKEVDELEETG